MHDLKHIRNITQKLIFSTILSVIIFAISMKLSGVEQIIEEFVLENIENSYNSVAEYEIEFKN